MNNNKTNITEINNIISEVGVINIIKTYHNELNIYKLNKKIMFYLKNQNSYYLKNLINFLNRIDFIKKEDVNMNNKQDGLNFLREMFDIIFRLDKKYINKIILMFEFKMVDDEEYFNYITSYETKRNKIYMEKKKMEKKIILSNYIIKKLTTRE